MNAMTAAATAMTPPTISQLMTVNRNSSDISSQRQSVESSACWDVMVGRMAAECNRTANCTKGEARPANCTGTARSEKGLPAGNPVKCILCCFIEGFSMHPAGVEPATF